jgi:hypothetical protein
MNRNTDHRDVLHVVQIALGVAMSVFLVAIYVRPVPVAGNGRVREVRTLQTIYLMEVKYLSGDGKPEPASVLSDEKPVL